MKKLITALKLKNRMFALTAVAPIFTSTAAALKFHANVVEKSSKKTLLTEVVSGELLIHNRWLNVPEPVLQ